ncbi:hypothetical protein [Pantoea septica]|uniref:hypothetical protein n=1 Tax=Pantoea septica TaxID=472695 RepID=UPI0023F9BED8|nr:hypothetical protein [Pantoea septica]
MQQRKTITLNLAGLLEQSPSARRFYEDYTQNAGHAVKRNLVDRIFRAGAVLDACGLSAIVNLLDNDVFQAASTAERQAMFFKAAELAGVIPAAAPVKSRKQGQRAEAVAESESVTPEVAPEEVKPEVKEPPASADKPATPRRTGAGKMFSSFQPPKGSGDA